jgi:hypothetical protein
VADALVAVNERVVLHQREAERRGLLDHGRMEIDTTERRLWLSDGGVERIVSFRQGCAGPGGRVRKAGRIQRGSG